MGQGSPLRLNLSYLNAVHDASWLRRQLQAEKIVVIMREAPHLIIFKSAFVDIR